MTVFFIVFMLILADFFKSQIGTQALGHNDAVGCLVVLQQGGDDAWEGKGASVECMREFHLAVTVFEAQFHTIGLERFEIRY